MVEPVVLRRAVTGSPSLWEWFTEARRDDAARSDVVIELCEENRERVVARWVLIGARPVRWTSPTLDANVQEVAVEELEISYQRLEWSGEDIHGDTQ